MQLSGVVFVDIVLKQTKFCHKRLYMQQSKQTSIVLLFFITFISIILWLSPVNSLQVLGSTPEATIAVVKDKYGVEMVYVPGGTFRMGTTIEAISRLCAQTELDGPECRDLLARGDVLSAYTVKTDSFWIDQFEVTVARYQLCVDNFFCASIDPTRIADLVTPDSKPQVNVTWYEAVRFCNFRGARLPTEEEWQYAASGPENYTYPWGNSLVKANLSYIESSHPVGSISGDRSWIGIYDMAGNVTEWVENIYLPYSHDISD
jgi:formylglycine-generating enzyme required for sulfatase activity